jgi:ribosomal protein S6
MVEKHEEKEGKKGFYELGYHLIPSLGEEDLALRVQSLVTLVTLNGGTLISEGVPQMYTLAYPMRKQNGGKWDAYRTAHFGWIRFETYSGEMARIKDALEHNDVCIRYLLISIDAKALEAKSASPVLEEDIKENVSFEEVVIKKNLDTKVKKEEKTLLSEEALEKEIADLIGSSETEEK